MLSDNDRQRIEQEAEKDYSTYKESGINTMYDVFIEGAEYATIYEREQQADGLKSIENPDHHIKVLKEQIQRMEKEYKELEAERTELRNKVIGRIKKLEEFQKTINVPPGWIQKEIDFLNSLKK